MSAKQNEQSQPMNWHEALKIKRQLRRQAARKARKQALESLGLKRVKGALGGIYWE